VDALEDPRLVRIADYEDGVSGRHDATRILTPFVQGLLRRGERTRVAILLLDGESLNKVGQTIVEMIRAGIGDLPVLTTVYYECTEAFAPDFLDSLPFAVHPLPGPDGAREIQRLANDPAYEYLLLFESSGMYRGDDIVNLGSHLKGGRLDAVWGSRRLSVNDIRAAYQLVYRHRRLRAAISWVGSHVLSLCYLAFYGRYLSDTLSGVRAIRTTYLRNAAYDYHRSECNQMILSNLLRHRAELFETPVYYFPLSPQRIRRTTIGDGLRALGAIVKGRFGRAGAEIAPGDSTAGDAPSDRRLTDDRGE